MSTRQPQVSIRRVFDAPRHLVYRAFTDPAQLASWWGPNGNSMPLDEIVMHVQTGGFQRWTEVDAGDPTIRTRISIDLTDVTHEEVLEGVMRVTGSLRGGFEPFDTRFRITFRDEPGGRTRLEVDQWLPDHVVKPAEQGWHEAFAKLDQSLRVALG